MKFIFFFLLLVISHYTASSQLNVIESRIVNPDQKPIEYATVILQDSQVKYIDGTITDSTGYFIIKHLPAGNYRLIIQHLLYESDTLYIQANMQIQPVITLIPRQYTLNEVQVSAEGPMMKVSGNMLSYNAQSIEKNKAITTAYEMLKEIPGIFEINNQLSLIGSEKLNIVINGQMTKMTIEQVSNMLKTIPSSNIANIEVMYNPPAKYNVRGALINIVLNKRTDEQPSVTGEVSASYKQSVYASNVDRINLVYNNSKFKVDFSATVNTGKSWDKNKSYSRHSLKDKIVKINEFINSRNNYLDIDFRTEAAYTFNKNSELIFSYFLNKEKKNGKSFATNDYTDINQYSLNSLNHTKDNRQLHNAYIQYSNRKFNIGAEYTFYKNPTDQHYTDEKDHQINKNYINNSDQKISKWSVFINHGVTFPSKLKLNYGINAGYNLSDTKVRYLFRQNDDYIEAGDLNLDGSQKEYTATPFIEASCRFNKKLSASISLKTEYFKSIYTDNGIRHTLWNDWSLFPNLSVTYSLDPRNTFQLNITSDKYYPSFWAINPQTTELNSYSEVVGNPELSPYKMYRGQFMYIRNRKYIFMGFIQYAPDYFSQLPHMSADEIKTIYRFENYDYLLRMGIAVILNVKQGKFFSSNITLQGINSREKIDDFYGYSFNHTSLSGVVNLNNSFNLTEYLLLQVNGHFQSAARQGVYKLGEIWKLSGRVKWTITKSLSFLINYDNILCHQRPRPVKLEYSNQYKLTRFYERSSVEFTLIWRLKNHKQSKYHQVDDSRLNR